MKFMTVAGTYFEVQKVTDTQYRIFYCKEEEVFGKENKKSERLISSRETHKQACKLAKQFAEIYNLGHSDGAYW